MRQEPLLEGAWPKDEARIFQRGSGELVRDTAVASLGPREAGAMMRDGGKEERWWETGECEGNGCEGAGPRMGEDQGWLPDRARCEPGGGRQSETAGQGWSDGRGRVGIVAGGVAMMAGGRARVLEVGGRIGVGLQFESRAACQYGSWATDTQTAGVVAMASVHTKYLSRKVGLGGLTLFEFLRPGHSISRRNFASAVQWLYSPFLTNSWVQGGEPKSTS